MCDETSHHDAGKRHTLGTTCCFGQQAAFGDGLRLKSDSETSNSRFNCGELSAKISCPVEEFKET